MKINILHSHLTFPQFSTHYYFLSTNFPSSHLGIIDRRYSSTHNNFKQISAQIEVIKPEINARKWHAIYHDRARLRGERLKRWNCWHATRAQTYHIYSHCAKSQSWSRRHVSKRKLSVVISISIIIEHISFSINIVNASAISALQLDWKTFNSLFREMASKPKRTRSSSCSFKFHFFYGFRTLSQIERFFPFYGMETIFPTCHTRVRCCVFFYSFQMRLSRVLVRQSEALTMFAWL